MSKALTTKEILHKSKSSLTVVLGYLQMLEKDLEGSSDNNKSLNLLQKAHQACLELQENIEQLESTAD